MMENTAKKLPDVIKKQMDYADAPIVDQGGMVIRGIASKEVVDRDGDIIYIDGIETENFMKNPVFLWMHDMCEYPVGKVTQLTKSVGPDGIKQLEATIEFAETEDGMECAYLYANGFLSAFSISIRPKEIGEVMTDGKWRGFDITKSEMYELSAVTVPANQEALIIKSLLKNRRDQMQTEKKLTNEIEKIRSESEERLKALESQFAEIASKATVKAEPTEEEVKAGNTMKGLLALATEIETKSKKKE